MRGIDYKRDIVAEPATKEDIERVISIMRSLFGGPGRAWISSLTRSSGALTISAPGWTDKLPGFTNSA